MPTAQQVKDFESKHGCKATVKGGKIVAAGEQKKPAAPAPKPQPKPAEPAAEKKAVKNSDTPKGSNGTGSDGSDAKAPSA